jgi:hypothetical protein
LTLSVQEITNRVRRIFGDDDGAQIQDTDIFQWVNSAQRQICTDNEELLEAIALTDIVAGQQDYSTPSDLNVLRSLMYNNFRLRGLSFAQFNEYIDGFKAPVSQGGYGNANPLVYMLYGGTITLFPTPNQNLTSGLRVYYSKFPATVSSMGDTLGVPDRYIESVIQFCLREAYEMDENADMAILKGNQFATQVQKLKDQEKKSTTEYYPTITTLPEDDMYLDSGGFYG